MSDSEKLAMVCQYIEERLTYLTRFIYHHECNIAQPNADEQADYLMALGQRRALMELSHKLMVDKR